MPTPPSSLTDVKVFTRSAATGAYIEREATLDRWLITDTLNGRTTANVTVFDPNGTMFYQRGENIKLTVDGDTLFEGYIIRAEEGRLGLDGSRTHQLDCADQHYLADKRVVARAYQNELSGDIVRDLITTYLDAEGVTPGVIDDGILIRELAFNYQTVSEALEELAERTNYWWAINADKTLDFRDPLALVFAPITWDSTEYSFDSTEQTFDETSLAQELVDEALQDTIFTLRANDQYRNTQWVRGGTAQTDEQIETQFGDGERQSFTVGFPIAKLPKVEVDTGSGFVEVTVGVQGLDTTQDFFFSFNSITLVQNSSDTPLSGTDRIRVTYVGLFNVITKVVDNDQIATRGTVEGGSGIFELVETDNRITSREAGLELGAELLNYYARNAFTVRFLMRENKYRVGDFVRVDYPEGGILNANCLVVETSFGTQDGDLRVNVTMVSGPVNNRWESYFARLAGALDRAADRAGGQIEVVTTVENFSKLWVPEERPNIFVLPLPGAGVFPSGTLVPAFEPSERVLFLAWFDGDDEVDRKPFTLQTGANTNEIVTTTLLGVNDAVGTFTHFGWFGGHTATGTITTGVLVDKQTFAFTKTNIEQIQVVKTDTKWS